MPRVSTKTITTEQLARRWGCRPKTLVNWRWLKKGPPFIKLLQRGNMVVYLLTEVRRYEKEHAITRRGG